MPMYTSFYKLTGKPFQLSPDPRFFYGSSAHRRAMSYLRYGLSQAEGFIVITGGIGTGKTTLVRNLFEELDRDEVMAAQLVTTQLDADDMLQLVVAAFGLEHEKLSKAVLIKRLEDFLAGASRDGKRVLLVVDEAQNLPAQSLEELRMLSNFQVSDKPLLQSFLLGQEEFRSTLQAPGLEQLRQRIIASCHLAPLEERETRDYIEHRLGVVGWDQDPLITRDAHAAIFAATDGIPRRVNVLCDRLLLFGYLEQKHEFAAETVEKVAAELSDELRPSSNDSVKVDMGQAPAAGEAPIAPPLKPSLTVNASEQDELGAMVDSLSRGLSIGGDVDTLVRLERRVQELERTVESLRRGFIQLAKRVRQG